MADLDLSTSGRPIFGSNEPGVSDFNSISTQDDTSACPVRQCGLSCSGC